MMSSYISISGPTHNICPTKHSKLFTSISWHLPERKDGKKVSLSKSFWENNSISVSGSATKIPAAISHGFAIQGSDEKERLAQEVLSHQELVPKHVALFTDGHGRWAARNGASIEDVYRAGTKKTEEVARLCHRLGIEVLSLFGFSTGNWVRPKEQIDQTWSLYEEYGEFGIDKIMEYKPRISIIGDTSKLPESLRKWIPLWEKITKGHKGLHIVVGLNYGGRQDILEATKAIAGKVKDGKMLLEEIDEKKFEAELQTKCTDLPCPDLFIRTGGKSRISNFMLWQMAYTELHFVDKLYPDFEEEDLLEAILSYQQRQRRFGGHDYKS